MAMAMVVGVTSSVEPGYGLLVLSSTEGDVVLLQVKGRICDRCYLAAEFASKYCFMGSRDVPLANKESCPYNK